MRPRGGRASGNLCGYSAEAASWYLVVVEERRSDPRVTFPVLVLYRRDPAEPFVSAYGEDLSVSGIRIEGTDVQAGDFIDLQLIERDGRRPLELLGEVMRVLEREFAVRFIEMDERQRGWLERVVHERAERDDPPPTEDLLTLGFDEV